MLLCETKKGYRNAREQKNPWFLILLEYNVGKYQVMVYPDGFYLEHSLMLVTEDLTQARAYYEQKAVEYESEKVPVV